MAQVPIRTSIPTPQPTPQPTPIYTTPTPPNKVYSTPTYYSNINQTSNTLYEDQPITDEYDTIKIEETVDSPNGQVNKTYPADNGNKYIIAVVFCLLGILAVSMFVYSIHRLVNRRKDDEPIDTSVMTVNSNKPLPLITQEHIIHKQRQEQRQFQQNQECPLLSVNVDVDDNGMENQDGGGYDDDDRISFLELGDSAIEPRKKSLMVREPVVRKPQNVYKNNRTNHPSTTTTTTTTTVREGNSIIHRNLTKESHHSINTSNPNISVSSSLNTNNNNTSQSEIVIDSTTNNIPSMNDKTSSHGKKTHQLFNNISRQLTRGVDNVRHKISDKI